MISKDTLLKLKGEVHNKKHIQVNETYFVNGEIAIKETFLRRLPEKTGYIVGHDDCLEKFIDVPDMHFKYERNEFTNFEDAIEFIIKEYHIEFS